MATVSTPYIHIHVGEFRAIETGWSEVKTIHAGYMETPCEKRSLFFFNEDNDFFFSLISGKVGGG